MNRNMFEEKGKTNTGATAKVVQNIYGNWYGYISGVKIRAFSGWDAEGDAMRWFYAKTRKPVKPAESVLDFKARIKAMAPKAERNAVTRDRARITKPGDPENPLWTYGDPMAGGFISAIRDGGAIRITVNERNLVASTLVDFTAARSLHHFLEHNAAE